MASLPAALASVGLALAILYGPGLAILECCAATRRIDRVSRLLIAPGVSAATYVVLFALCYQLDGRLGWWTPWAILILAAVALLVPRRRIPRVRWTTDSPAYLTLLLVAVVLLATRLSAIRGLAAPLWGDSVHHAVIVQLMLDHGGLFQSWRPYDDAATFTYHFGFHAVATMYAWMRDVGAEAAILMMGQIANVSAVMSLYALTRLWTTSVWGGVFSVVIGGFISTYPQYFVYWGRYTQLAGHVILITALVLLETYLRQPRRRENIAFLVVTAVVVAGLGLAQYKVAVIFVAVSVALVVTRMIRRYQHRRDVRDAFLASVGRAAAVAGLALMIFMPRGWEISRGPLGMQVAKRITMAISAQSTVNALPPLSASSGFEHAAMATWAVVFVAMAVIIVKRHDALWFVAGAGLCLIVMNPGLVGLRREGLIDAFHVTLSMYIFAATVAGLAIGTFLQTVARRWRHRDLLAAACCVVLTGIGVAHASPFPRGAVFVLPDDVQMMHWIKDNVPANAKIAAPGFVAQETFTCGRDAGWWIPFYTGHRTNLMLMAAAQEQPSEQRVLRSELGFTKALYALDMSLPTSTDWFVAQGFRYFYVGAKPFIWRGADRGAEDRALVEQLLRNPDWKVIHQSGDARLLEVARGGPGHASR
ncbi:MAG TPA: DUF6541 family protein [Candidatus Methylomirabilis sp.]|nr:DUF6541 family protein [Candidatus Methylomirabilis sp.]